MSKTLPQHQALFEKSDAKRFADTVVQGFDDLDISMAWAEAVEALAADTITIEYHRKDGIKSLPVNMAFRDGSSLYATIEDECLQFQISITVEGEVIEYGQ